MSSSRIIGLKFDSLGLLIEKSSLLLDEEMAIMDENKDLPLTKLSYDVISSFF